MIKIEHLQVFNFEGALRGMRNPLGSWNKSDSDVAFHAVENFASDDPMTEKYREWNDNYGLNIKIGPNDLDLMHRLFKAGPEHRKYLRQIFICMDITAPRYWWVEIDQYKVGTVTDSCSTMHTLTKKPFERDDFSYDNMSDDGLVDLYNTIERLNYYRDCYIGVRDLPEGVTKGHCWFNMITLLPQSFNQKRTFTMNYENAINMIHQRTFHKLPEWRDFCNYLRENLPYFQEIVGNEL